jgi:hypothetical protein
MKLLPWFVFLSLDASVSIKSRLDGRGTLVRLSTGSKRYCSSSVSTPFLEPTQLRIRLVSGAVSSGIKRLGREADHAPPSSAEIRNDWSYTSAPQCVFIAWQFHLSIYPCCSHFEHRISVKRFVSLQFINSRQSVGLLGRGINLTQGRYLHTNTE